MTQNTPNKMLNVLLVSFGKILKTVIITVKRLNFLINELMA